MKILDAVKRIRVRNITQSLNEEQEMERWSKGPFRVELIQVPEIYRHQLADAGLLHGNPINHIHCAHRGFVMRNDDEL